ncbi:Pre-mRNA-splicing factor of RES complex-domain-containing protein [Schizothecium vesticola]|uniref:Pre-mRNA-splicing factor of RES complex-domain-containing protein n=1 Tax=Schizothecium vesticola TaxID=314040 RepID=A0AA40K9S2_9PEZI|nr:Pre-mRNA-splicing factor of RES complex-domain-containing protein [Schizothecium vesticola]
MPSDKAAYLAAHYLSADPKPSSTKKRKRKHAAPSTANGLLIQDDDEPGWSTTATTKPLDDDDPDGNGGTPTVSGTSAEFRRAKKSGWKTLSTSKPDDTSAAEADAIIAAAATDHAAAARLADGDLDDPTTTTLTTTKDAAPPPATMSNGTLPGLQPASAITSQLRAVQAAERAELARMQASGTADEPVEVILRDATGRRVDASMRRAEMRRAQAEAERAEEARKTALKGEVQLAEARRRREAVEEAALMTVARGKDDEGINAEMKAEGRWNDPMAEFLGGTAEKAGGGKRRKGKRPVYGGAAPPNRYGIRPGYRWDGVDRGNGFEAERFKAINRRERNKDLSYHWQMDE